MGIIARSSTTGHQLPLYKKIPKSLDLSKKTIFAAEFKQEDRLCQELIHPESQSHLNSQKRFGLHCGVPQLVISTKEKERLVADAVRQEKSGKSYGKRNRFISSGITCFFMHCTDNGKKGIESIQIKKYFFHLGCKDSNNEVKKTQILSVFERELHT